MNLSECSLCSPRPSDFHDGVSVSSFTAKVRRSRRKVGSCPGVWPWGDMKQVQLVMEEEGPGPENQRAAKTEEKDRAGSWWPSQEPCLRSGLCGPRADLGLGSDCTAPRSGFGSGSALTVNLGQMLRAFGRLLS